MRFLEGEVQTYGPGALQGIDFAVGCRKLRVDGFGHAADGGQIVHTHKYAKPFKVDFVQELLGNGVTYLQILQTDVGRVLQVTGLRLHIFISAAIKIITGEVSVGIVFCPPVQMGSQYATLPLPAGQPPEDVRTDPGITLAYTLEEYAEIPSFVVGLQVQSTYRTSPGYQLAEILLCEGAAAISSSLWKRPYVSYPHNSPIFFPSYQVVCSPVGFVYFVTLPV